MRVRVCSSDVCAHACPAAGALNFFLASIGYISEREGGGWEEVKREGISRERESVRGREGKKDKERD